MAHRRRQGLKADSYLDEETVSNPTPFGAEMPSLAAKAIRASSAHHDSSLSSAYGHSAHSPSPKGSKHSPFRSSKDSSDHGYTMKGLDSNKTKRGFWGTLAKKAKSIIEDDSVAQRYETPERRRLQMSDSERRLQMSDSEAKVQKQYQSAENRRKTDNPSLQKGLDAITSSINYIGGTIGNALEEGMTIVENRTADIIQETRKLQIGKKVRTSDAQRPALNVDSTSQPSQTQTHIQPQLQTDMEIQLKASRDVAMAMAAKAKLLLRELKTVKADFAFAKERCAQLEEEIRVLRESRESGRDTNNPEDDDLIRLQLETLLAEKARLAQENSVYARENRFLREIVEYHQLTMQDVVYLDEGSEEVMEVYPVRIPSTNNLQSLYVTPHSLTPTPPARPAEMMHDLSLPHTLASEPDQNS